ncbi:MAG: class I SAM-dependent methyltransferase [Thermoleophilia bacterium]|nr:class I SAM-dependent methyltransferase [Thermoleophilia bacterium]
MLRRVERYYTGKFTQHGATPRGVDWNSVESQALRFEQVLKVCDTSRPFRLLDYGCGYGALLDHVRARGFDCEYVGFDLSAPMLDHARDTHPRDAAARFVGEAEALEPVDYVVASGILNVRQDVPVDDWRAYVLSVIGRLGALGTRGFSFNSLTSYSDADRMRPDLYYPDPCDLFDHCKREHSRNVALLHDYGLYEFTILVRKDV